MGEKVEKCEGLEVWKEGMRLATKIYRVLDTCRGYGLRDQMEKAMREIQIRILSIFYILQRVPVLNSNTDLSGSKDRCF
jgi:hypothetical protein